MDNVIILDAINNSINGLNSNIGQLDQKVTNTQLSNVSNTVNIVNNTTKQILYIEQSNTNLLMTINCTNKWGVFFEATAPGNYTIKMDKNFNINRRGIQISRVFTMTNAYEILTFPNADIIGAAPEISIYLIPSLYYIGSSANDTTIGGVHINLGKRIKIYGNITYKNEADLPVLISNRSV